MDWGKDTLRAAFGSPVLSLPLSLAGALTALASVLGLRAPSARGLTVGGSTSVQPFAEKWAEGYRAGRPGLPIRVQGGGSTAGVQPVLSGVARIDMLSRALIANERGGLSRR